MAELPPATALPVGLRRFAAPGVAVGAVLVAVAVTMAIRPYLGAAPLAILHLAVLSAAVVAGTAAGWVAVVLSLAAAAVLSGGQGPAWAAVMPLLVWAAVASAIVLLVGRVQAGGARFQARHLEIERLNRLYDALSQVNQAIVWSQGRDQLLRKVCRVLVERGGFQMAWIGWHDEETRRLVPVADWGDLDGYLTRIQVFTDDRPEGQGPSGAAFRSGRPYICNDRLADPTTLPWRAEAARQGFRASAVFPIRRGGEVCATLNVYAPEAGFFKAREVALLEEAATDISFALGNFARDEERRAAGATVERERALVDTFFDSVPGVLYVYDDQGRFLRWNRNFVTVTGYTEAQLKSMHPLDLFAGGERERVADAIAGVFATGEGVVEAGFRSSDGRVTPYYFTGRRIVLDDRPCLVGIGIDISDRVRAEESLRRSEERYHSTLDGMMEGSQLLDFDWRYLYLNDAAAVHNRRPNADLLGRTMPECWPGIEGTSVYAVLERCMVGRVAAHEEIEFRFADGQSAWFDIRAQPVPEGIFVLSIDISDRRRAEQALLEAKADLERKVEARTAELQGALVRAEAADRIKSAFLATMSHELRTPLNSILGFTGIVLQGLAGPVNAEQTRQLGMVRGSARHLLDLINDVLDISKIEAGQMAVRLEPFHLLPSIEGAVATVRPLAEHKELALDVTLPEELPSMRSDRRRVDQILLNLLNNAVKFTERGGVALSVEAGPSVTLGDRPAVRICVTDTGIGIKADDLRTLFQPFRQLDTGLARQHEGTGLGLAICRRLTDLLGGEIRAESVWGAGSTFSVTLPLEPGA